MTRSLAAAFVLLLVGAHFADASGQAFGRPLSMFRDSDPAWIGYTLFALLLAIGAATIWTVCRVRSLWDAAVYVLFCGLLVYVAATPSDDSRHVMSAAGLMYFLFGYLALRLYRAGDFLWFLVHLAIPSFLVFATSGNGYGIWQKLMIVYFVFAIVVHESILSAALPRKRRQRGRKIQLRVGRKRPPADVRLSGPLLPPLTRRPSAGRNSVFRETR